MLNMFRKWIVKLIKPHVIVHINNDSMADVTVRFDGEGVDDDGNLIAKLVIEDELKVSNLILSDVRFRGSYIKN